MNYFRPETVLLANGTYPTHTIPQTVLRNATRIISCDGASAKLLADGLEPDFIIGDLDSIPKEVLERYSAKVIHRPDQNTNDLSKAFRFCIKKGWRDIGICGATGGREDHTLGNISLLADFATMANVRMFTNEGLFTSIRKSSVFASFPGQQVSIFSLLPNVKIYSEGLRYSLEKVPFTRWWQGTLNEAEGDTFKLVFETGTLIVYQTYPAPEELK